VTRKAKTSECTSRRKTRKAAHYPCTRRFAQPRRWQLRRQGNGHTLSRALTPRTARPPVGYSKRVSCRTRQTSLVMRRPYVQVTLCITTTELFLDCRPNPRFLALIMRETKIEPAESSRCPKLKGIEVHICYVSERHHVTLPNVSAVSSIATTDGDLSLSPFSIPQ
jgi:hypothetical protein